MSGNSLKVLYTTTPCKNCPFRKDVMSGWLGEARIKEIVDSDSFVCHKTTNGSIKERKQCSGHMMLLEEENQFVKMANNWKIPLTLKGRDKVFDNKEDCINHHKY